MAGPYPLATLAAQITSTGVSAPPFEDVFASLQAIYQGIYGSDAYLQPDSQDGQFLAALAAIINDCNNGVIAVYNAFSPASAIGAGLSSVVKINGLRRLRASNSSASVDIVGQAGTEIDNGLIEDVLGNQWALPAQVIIPPAGTITVTAVAVDLGSIQASAGTIIKIVTPTRGWQSVTNPADATVGAPIENDATLRGRQAVSTSLPAQTPLESIVAAVRNLLGVQTVQPYENDTSITDGNGIPSHSISLVIVGGDDVEIATAIADGKLGTGTFGTTSETIIDQNGVPDVIHFYRPTMRRVIAEVDLTALTGYVTSTGTSLVAALAAYVSGLAIGGDVFQSKCETAANLNNGPLSSTFNITAVKIAFFGNALGTADLPIAFNELAGLAVADVTLVVT